MRPAAYSFFFKFHAQGEEIHPFTRLFAHGNIAQHAGFAIADHCAAIGKAAELAGFHHKRAAGKSCFKLAVVGGRLPYGMQIPVP